MFIAIIQHVLSGKIIQAIGPYDNQGDADQAGLDESRALNSNTCSSVDGLPNYSYRVLPLTPIFQPGKTIDSD